MFLLSESIKKTISIAEGYQVGRLIIEEIPYIELDNGQMMVIESSHVVEILNDGEWQRLKSEDYEIKTVEGWPLFAGADARFKRNTSHVI